MSSLKQKCKRLLIVLDHAFGKIRTGRASPAMVEDIPVSYYGINTPLKQVATIAVENARTLAITPWERHLIPDIEKAIHASGTGFNPVTTGEIVRIPMPVLTEENRKEYVRHARQEAENGRVAVRNVRRDANHQAKENAENEDEERQVTGDVQN